MKAIEDYVFDFADEFSLSKYNELIKSIYDKTQCDLLLSQLMNKIFFFEYMSNHADLEEDRNLWREILKVYLKDIDRVLKN